MCVGVVRYVVCVRVHVGMRELGCVVRDGRVCWPHVVDAWAFPVMHATHTNPRNQI